MGGATSQYLVYLDQGFTSLPFGGEGGIRTLGEVLPHGGLANRCTKPTMRPLHMMLILALTGQTAYVRMVLFTSF